MSELKYEECPVCLDKFTPEDKPLECGHWIHKKCVEKHFKPECPVCRKPLNIKVNGTRPDGDIEYDPLSITDSDYKDSMLSQYYYLRSILDSMTHEFPNSRNMASSLLNFPEPIHTSRSVRIITTSNDDITTTTTSSYIFYNGDYIESYEDINQDNEEEDEENPHGDNWDYEDV